MFSHEKLDVYKVALEYVRNVNKLQMKLKGRHRAIKDQIVRASQSIVLNIAEGNGKTSEADRRRFFEIARGSALECAAAQDILEVYEELASNENLEMKVLLDRIVAMLTRLGGRGYQIRETAEIYESLSPAIEDQSRLESASMKISKMIDTDTGAEGDTDSDTDADADVGAEGDVDADNKLLKFKASPHA